MNSSKMTPEERGSLPPRPPGHSAGPLPASAPKRRFVKLGRKPSDDGSVKSGSSGCSTKSESVGVALRQPSRSRIRRHTNRLSGVFQRGPASSLAQPMALTSDTSSSSFPAYTRKDSLTPGDPTDDPSELSNQITAPGILKIFGSEICEGANYKSVLATTHSSAKELVKEALDRYGLNKEEAESYVLCDAIGHVGGHQWRTECFRVVCDNEKPLLLQALWKPREGLARRFEIQRRSAVEEKRSREKDTITAGINAQARKLQKSRSRVNSTLSERVSCRAQGLWRSLSEVDLTDQAGGYALKDSRENLGHEEEEPERNYEENQEENADRHPKQHRKENVKQNPSVLFEVDGGSERLENGEMERAMTGREKSGRVQEGGEREEREGEERESSDDNVTQFSFHPPHHCPYLLLLQGHSLKQDFVINLLSGSSTVIGRRREDGERSSADLLLSAPDILPRHCCLRRYSNRRSTRLHLFDGAVVTRNGMVVSKGAELASGDVIGLGQHYMFLFKDPTALAVMHKDPVAASSVERPLTSAPQLPSQATAPPPPSPPTGVTLLCSTCTSALTGPQTSRGPRRATPYLKDAGGRDLTLPYHAEYEQRIVREIVAAGSGGKDRPPLAVAFLLCACVQHAATHLLSSDLRRLLLLIAGQVQSAMWEHTKELAASQPEVDTQELPALAMPELLSGLRPLVVWMSNALELLQFIQHQLPHLLAWRSHPDQGEGPEGDREVQDEASMALLEMRLSCVRSASEETMTVLEEVIMLTFQQCVYYITKALYPLLPGLLDSHPSRGSSEPRLPGRGGPFLGSGGPLVPGETEQVLEVLTETRQLLQSCQVHRDLCSQLLAYLFYFINASLLNTLMERGSEAGFYQWARGVSIRVNLDLLLDWAHRSGLGELALEHTHTLSSAVNLLATPTQNLVQASWTSLRSEFSALSPAQMHHLLRGYTPPPPCPDRWGPTPQEERAALNTADILESFDSHPPLALPDGGFRLDLSRAVKDPALVEQLDWLRRVVSGLSESPFPGNAAGEASLQYSTAVPLEAKITKMAAHPKASLESLETPPAEVVLPPELLLLQGPCPPSPPLTRGPTSCGLGSCGDLLAQKLQSLELQSREAGGCGDDGLRRSALDPSCLLTPPNTPHNLEPVEPETEHLNGDVRGGLQPPLTRMSSLDQHGHDVLEEGCLSADRTGNGIILGEDEEEEEGDEGEVFILELQRGARGLGLALVDARDSQLRASGIFIRAVIPDSPAARSQKLGPGDRILAVNGVSLVGLDYQSGHELIRSSGERPRLLVARSDWTTKTIQTQ